MKLSPQIMKQVFLSASGYDNDLWVDQERWIEAYLDFQDFDQNFDRSMTVSGLFN